MINNRQSGFTAVELLITLFVAAAFLVAGYQLYAVIIKDSGQTRGEARASNVAYDYIRRYTTSATNPCTTSTPINDAPISVAGISAVTVTIEITCPYTNQPSISKIEAIVLYNNPQQTVKYGTFVTGVGYVTTPVSPVGLVGWWRFNGNANDSSGNGKNGTVTAATPTTGQNGQPNNAYDFNGSTAYISMPSGFSDFGNGITISVWMNPDTTTSWARIIDFGNGAPSNNILFARPGTYSQVAYQVYSGATNTLSFSTAEGSVQNGAWHHYAVTQGPDGTAIIYIDGTQRATGVGPLPTTVTRTINYIGRSLWSTDPYYDGKYDDLRIYSRGLSALEISNLYAEGAQ